MKNWIYIDFSKGREFENILVEYCKSFAKDGTTVYAVIKVLDEDGFDTDIDAGKLIGRSMTSNISLQDVPNDKELQKKFEAGLQIQAVLFGLDGEHAKLEIVYNYGRSDFWPSMTFFLS